MTAEAPSFGRTITWIPLKPKLKRISILQHGLLKFTYKITILNFITKILQTQNHHGFSNIVHHVNNNKYKSSQEHLISVHKY